MNSKMFIAGDWGTTNLRLFLCEYPGPGASLILQTINGPGVSQIKGEFEETFFGLVENWVELHGQMPVIISGMAGSTIGWKEAHYIPCPATADQISQGRVTFQVRGLEISIISGLKTYNPIGSPDVMRGEELQIMGWMQLAYQRPESELIALPGTHNKWVLTQQNRIETFVTALTGELFSLLKNNSVLIAKRDENEFFEKAFFKGVEVVERLGQAQLIHALFSTRSQQLIGGVSQEQGLSYLSGLLIAADILGAISLFRQAEPEIESVTLIGDDKLCDRYKRVLDYLGIKSVNTDAAKIALAGYESVYEHLYI